MEFSPQDWITGAWWTYLIVGAVIAGSAVFPPLPSESLLITAASFALTGDLNSVLVALATTTGALLGDLAAYTIGHRINSARHGREQEGRLGSALTWLERHERGWGPGLIVAARFVPGGTTLVGLAAGALAYPLTRFASFAAVGALLWTGYGFVFAHIGRAATPASPWTGILVAIGLALTIGGIIELLRRHLTRRKNARASRRPHTQDSTTQGPSGAQDGAACAD